MSTVLVQGRNLCGKLKQEIAENILSQVLMLLSHSPEKNYRHTMAVFNRIAKTEHQKMIAGQINNWLSEDNPGRPFLTRVLKGVHPNVRKNYFANMIVGLFFRAQRIYDRLRGKYGFNPSSVMLISSDMRCNYKCNGCYAGSE